MPKTCSGIPEVQRAAATWRAAFEPVDTAFDALRNADTAGIASRRQLCVESVGTEPAETYS